MRRRPARSRSANLPFRAGFQPEPLERRDCPAVVTISAAADHVDEETASTTFEVRLSEPAASQMSVGYLGLGTAGGADYRLSIGSRQMPRRSGEIVFGPGESVKTVTMTLANDTLREGDETATLLLYRPKGCTLGEERSATVTISDDDSYTASIVPLAGPDENRLQPGDRVPFLLQLSSPATRTEVFTIRTSDGTAVGREDYSPLRKIQVVLLPGQSEKQFWVRATPQDVARANDEFFFIKAEPRSRDFPPVEWRGAWVVGAAPAEKPELTLADADVPTEADKSRIATFTLTLSAPSPDPVSLIVNTRDLDLTGAARAANGDYVAIVNREYVIAPGKLTQTIEVELSTDTIKGLRAADDGSVFQIVVSNLTANAVVSGPASATARFSPFRIEVSFPDSSLTPTQREVFVAAARHWSRVITSDLANIDGIDDLRITATGVAIDGAYGILGQAGPRDIRPNTDGQQYAGSDNDGLPYTGAMQFDTADLSWMEQQQTLESVITHEMGHVIGIGTIWTRFIRNAGTATVNYVGANALREYRSLKNDQTVTSIPVENVGGSGSVDSHWRESVFDTELMTSVAERPGVEMPISRMTVGALQDIGYAVNYSKADSYTLPRAGLVAAQAAQSVAARSRPVAADRTSAALLPRMIPMLAAQAAASLDAVQPTAAAFAAVGQNQPQKPAIRAALFARLG